MLCERTFQSRLTLREEGQVELLGRRLTDLARVAVCQTPRGNVNPESRQPVTQLLYRGLPYMAGTHKPSVLGHVLLCVSEVSFFFCQRAGNGGHA